MWALGCILYEIWTQDSSFVKESFGMASKLGKDPELLSRLDDMAIEQILRIFITILAIALSLSRSILLSLYPFSLSLSFSFLSLSIAFYRCLSLSIAL
jgi:hypothetical protein